MNPSLCHAGSRIQKISSTLRKVIGDGVTGSVSDARVGTFQNFYEHAQDWRDTFF